LRRRVGKLERAFLSASRGGENEKGGGERAYHRRIMTETEFHSAVEGVLARIESTLEAHGELDVSLEGGVLTVECEDGSKIIVNRQTPNREIWIAARSGGFHFRHREGEWRDTRSNEEFFSALSRVVDLQSGVKAAFN